MTNHKTSMANEIEEAPAILARQAIELARPLGHLLPNLHRPKPSVVVTCARGSSAHAATFGKHLIERYLELPVVEAAPSISSIYRRRLNLRNQLLLAISQSGCSNDLIAFATDARSSGALTVAITNAPDSPLATACEHVLPLAAGQERSVAATKTFMATATVLMRLVGAWTDQPDLLKAVSRLPDRLALASKLEWTSALEVLSQTDHLVTLGRGPTLAIAREAALKLKETCGLHAEAHSAAEFLHGPVTLIGPGYPLLVFMPTDEAAPTTRQLCHDLQTKRARLLLADAITTNGSPLPVLPAEQPEADALCLLQSSYMMTVALAAELGVDVDNPPHLLKVTRTT
jgi:glucosamine--fructose-6-phosphate aminotransferase (isomerizing)